MAAKVTDRLWSLAESALEPMVKVLFILIGAALGVVGAPYLLPNLRDSVGHFVFDAIVMLIGALMANILHSFVAARYSGIR